MSGHVLHGYWRSSASFRVRIGLNLKGIPYRQVTHHLRRGEQRDPGYLALNPQGLVPALVLPGGQVLTQSLAILDYLDEVRPDPPFLPPDPLGRAQARATAQAVAVDAHPLGNLRVLGELRSSFGAGDAEVAAWFRRWATAAFDAIEPRLARGAGPFCHGSAPTLADICLVPQVANGARFGVNMAPYPAIGRIHAACLALEPFDAARPERQPDAE